MNMHLVTHNLTVRIANNLICRHLNLHIQAGDRWGLLGPNGSGKTTLLHTLAGLLPITQGEIWLQGKKLSSLSKKQIAQQLGILFQDTTDVFPQSVFDFCSSGRYPHLSYFAWRNKQDKQITAHALHVMGLERKLQQKVNTLSGGERRRLAIATLLTQAPLIYLLDEPTNHLDLHYQIKVLRYFKQLAKTNSLSVLMSLHDINLAAFYCTHILMLFGDGESLQGTPQDIFTEENLERLYQCQFQSVTVGPRELWVPYY